MGKCGFIAGWDHTGTHEQRGLHHPPGVKILMNHFHSTLFTSLSPVVTITTFPWHQHLCVVSHPPPFSLNCSAVQRIPQHSAFAPNKRVTMGRPGLDRNPVGSAQPNLNQGIASHCSVLTVERVAHGAGAGRSSGVLTSLFTAK